MSITLVQSTSKDAGTVTSTTLAYASNVTAGNFLAGDGRTGGSGHTGSFSDNLNGNWNKDVSSTSSIGELSMNSFANTAAGACTVTMTNNVSASARLIIEEWSGIATSSALDQTAQATGSSTAPSSGATSATSQANELVRGAVAWSTTPGTITPGSGFTLDLTVASILSDEYQVVSSTGAQTATYSTTGSTTWNCGVATYKAASNVSVAWLTA